MQVNSKIDNMSNHVAVCMAQELQETFAYPGVTALTERKSAVWLDLADAFSQCDQLIQQQQLLLRPITHTIATDRTLAVRKVCCQVKRSCVLASVS